MVKKENMLFELTVKLWNNDSLINFASCGLHFSCTYSDWYSKHQRRQRSVCNCSSPSS